MKKEVKTASFFYVLTFFLLLVIPQTNVRASVSHFDIFAHIAGFFLLYFILRRGLELSEYTSFIITVVTGIVSEGLQYFLPYRSFSLLDLASDILGVSIAFFMSHREGFIEKFISTCCLVGKSPIAPGTLAAFLITVIVFFAKPSFLFILECLTLLLFAGWAASSIYADMKNTADPRDVVIDEVTGVLTVFLFLPKISALNFLLAFVLFRLYDIIKPFGIKRVEDIGGGLAIMLDDELAGIYAGITFLIVNFVLKKGGIL